MPKRNNTEKGRSCSFQPEDVRRVEVDSRISQLHVLASHNDEIRAEWNDTSVRKTRVSLRGNTLQISEDTVVAFYEIFGIIELEKDKDFYLYLPERFGGDISIRTSHEPVSFDGIQMDAKVKVHTGSGAIRLANVASSAWQLRSDCGSICADRIGVSSNLLAETPVGDINIALMPHPQGYDIHARSDMGRCSVPQNSEKGKIPVETISTTGTIHIKLEAEQEVE